MTTDEAKRRIPAGTTGRLRNEEAGFNEGGLRPSLAYGAYTPHGPSVHTRRDLRFAIVRIYL
ncbi:MAG: hypothetical protein HKO98_05810 [Gemmatimonadetes bacterium]|nr:hypothetical protein [Gemmatimonadota bacterium]